MKVIARLASNPVWFWLLLSVPALPMLWELSSGTEAAERLLHPTGEFAARFLIVALAITPLRLIFPNAGWLKWLARRRRALGVAAFGYAALHTLLYIVDTATVRGIWAEFFALGIWTGWAALAIFIPLAVTSNDTAKRLLRRGWYRLHRWVYGAAILTLLHRDLRAQQPGAGAGPFRAPRRPPSLSGVPAIPPGGCPDRTRHRVGEWY